MLGFDPTLRSDIFWQVYSSWPKSPGANSLWVVFCIPCKFWSALAWQKYHNATTNCYMVLFFQSVVEICWDQKWSETVCWTKAAAGRHWDRLFDGFLPELRPGRDFQRHEGRNSQSRELWTPPVPQDRHRAAWCHNNYLGKNGKTKTSTEFLQLSTTWVHMHLFVNVLTSAEFVFVGNCVEVERLDPTLQVLQLPDSRLTVFCLSVFLVVGKKCEFMRKPSADQYDHEPFFCKKLEDIHFPNNFIATFFL